MTNEAEGKWHTSGEHRQVHPRLGNVPHMLVFNEDSNLMGFWLPSEEAEEWRDYLNALEAAVARVPLLESENNRLEKQSQRTWDERCSYLNHLRNLLARIHRDGGHYVEEHGLEKAVEDAHQVWAELRLRAEAAALTTTETGEQAE